MTNSYVLNFRTYGITSLLIIAYLSFLLIICYCYKMFTKIAQKVI